MFNKAPSFKQLVRATLCMFSDVIESKILHHSTTLLVAHYKDLKRDKMSNFFLENEIKGFAVMNADHNNSVDLVYSLSVIDTKKAKSHFPHTTLSAGKKALEKYIRSPEMERYAWGERAQFFTLRGKIDGIVGLGETQRPRKQTAQDLCNVLECLFEIHQETWYLYDKKLKSIKDHFSEKGYLNYEIARATKLVISSYFLYKCAQHLMFQDLSEQQTRIRPLGEQQSDVPIINDKNHFSQISDASELAETVKEAIKKAVKRVIRDVMRNHSSKTNVAEEVTKVIMDDLASLSLSDKQKEIVEQEIEREIISYFSYDFHEINPKQKEAVEYLRKYINDANFMMLDKSRIKWSLKRKGIDPRILLAYLEPHEIASIQTALDPLHKIPLLSLLTEFLLTIFYTLIPSNKTEELEKNLEILRDGIKADFRKELEKENSYTR